ncbi:MAG: hypothetical protein SGILL_005586 [Bacillariaceae sp.]
MNCSSPLCRVEMLHVPWNPADVNTVQGRYASPYGDGDNYSPSNLSRYFENHNVAGSEGWGRVTDVAGNTAADDDNHRIREGDLVTVGLPGMGTLRSSLWVPSHALLPVPDELLDKMGPAGCSLFQLGGTALRMLTDFMSLEPGDTVIQNAGNSGVGLMVSQLAAERNVSTISMVRRGSKSPQEFDELKDYLERNGKAAMVVAEEDLVDKEAIREFQQKLRDLSVTNNLPKLALNAVGGSSAQLMLKMLNSRGTMVTYGGMSGKGIEVATPHLIFKDLKIAGYWHSRWMVNHNVNEKEKMIHTLVQAALDDKVDCPPLKVFPLEDVKAALKWQGEQSNSVIRSKLVFDCRGS